MKINQKILSIPPYISTSWKNVISLHIEKGDMGDILIIGLVNGSAIEIPNLESSSIDSVFSAHQKFLEQESAQKTPSEKNPSPFFPHPPNSEIGSAILSLPLNFGLGGDMGNLLQHDSQASDSADLPSEILEKIASMSKMMGINNLENLPKAEPHCNCMHCQVMRVMHGQTEKPQASQIDEEEVSEEDLRFKEWDIEQTGENLFVVSNPLESQEQYNVFLGKPVGCTCGHKNCEHIRAVLNS